MIYIEIESGSWNGGLASVYWEGSKSNTIIKSKEIGLLCYTAVSPAPAYILKDL